MASLRDIARRAGTSVSTVSLVLNGRPSSVRISEATRQAVLAAARELGYTPHLAARRLRAKTPARRLIVLAIAHPVDSRLSLISRIIRGMQHHLGTVQTALAQAGLETQLTVETYQPGHLHRLRGLREPLWYHGLLVTNTTPEDDAFLHTLETPLPFVVFQRVTPHNAVNADNRAAARRVAQHLLALGHQQLAVMAPETASEAHQLRVAGFLETVAASGRRAEAIIAPGTPWTDAAYHTARALFARPASQRPTALFATNDLLALGILRAARESGVRVPDDLAVVGFDDAEFAQYTVPALTTVHLPIEEMAARATAILLDLIQQRATPPVQVEFPTRLVVRESCGGARQSDRPATTDALSLGRPEAHITLF